MVAACAAKPQKLIIGKWTTPSGGIVEIEKDGALTISMSDGTVLVKTQYRLVNDLTLEMDKTIDGGGTITWSDLKIGRDEMSYSIPEGGRMTLKRVK